MKRVSFSLYAQRNDNWDLLVSETEILGFFNYTVTNKLSYRYFIFFTLEVLNLIVVKTLIFHNHSSLFIKMYLLEKQGTNIQKTLSYKFNSTKVVHSLFRFVLRI